MNSTAETAFISELIQKAIPVTIYLMSGYQVKGVIKAADDTSLVVDQELREMLIYKQAVSTITPIKGK